ncbi:GcvH Glycine cleavage system H protein (lipoate-binding) [actinobacterium SCGC AAA044-D11]
MSLIPDDLQFTKEHEWVATTSDPKTFRIGITDFAQGALGDIVYIQLPKVGDSVVAGSICGEIESTKSVSEIYSPLTGTIVAVNGNLDSAPEAVNAAPYGEGWIAEIAITGTLPNLLSPQDYAAITA